MILPRPGPANGVRNRPGASSIQKTVRAPRSPRLNVSPALASLGAKWDTDTAKARLGRAQEYVSGRVQSECSRASRSMGVVGVDPIARRVCSESD